MVGLIFFFKQWKQECCFHTTEHFSCTIFFLLFVFAKLQHPCTMNDTMKLSLRLRKKKKSFSMTVTIFCGCYIIGNCLLWADFGSQHYWLWVTPDARVGWAMSSRGWNWWVCHEGVICLFGQGIGVKTHNLQNPSEASCPTDYMFIKAH